MQFQFPESRAYRDFTRNGLTSQDPSPYPSGTSNARRWHMAMRKLEIIAEKNERRTTA